MKLKKLEIIGFKSFCEKSAIQFPPGVSAVVGPNGCGKSNVVDALRWVMGEQSLKQLRGKNKEDIIFAGANGKPPMSMAEVSITMMNDNGSAPEEFRDYSEIMVTRRLFRSGESGYLINKQPARLKDVHNIFAGSGVGPRTYAVIQQGNIGAITDAGPDQRRVFIEEAAGVTRYKIRKQEALSKLKSTNQNLLRVNDIISEVNRQMAGLKRQAKKAEQYKSYQGRIKALDSSLLLHYHSDLSEQIRKSGALLEELKDVDIGHTTKLKKIDTALEEIKLQRTEKDREISEQKSRHFELQRKTDRMESDLNHSRDDVKRLADETLELGNAQKDMEEKNEQIIGEIKDVAAHHASMETKIASIKTHLEQEAEASQDLREQLATLNQQLESHKSSLMTLVADEARYKNIYQTASDNKESLKRKLRRIDEEEMVAARNVRAMEKNEEDSHLRLNEIKAQIEALTVQIQHIRIELTEKSNSLARHIKKTQIIELEHNKAKSKLTTLKKMEDNFEWYKDGVKAIMQARNTPEATEGPNLSADVLCLMADIVEPEPEYEIAVESVMGEALQYVIVKDQESGVDAIDYLQTTRSGRGGFIPINRITIPTAESLTQLHHEMLLRNHVRVKPGYEKLVDALLANVIVSPNLSDAIATYNRNNDLMTIVTLEGDIISDQGVMVGGSRENLSGILAKKQELKNLEKNCEKLHHRLTDYRQIQKQLEDESRALEVDLQRTVERKNETSQEQMEAEKACYKAVEELKSVRRHLEIVRLEQEQLMGEESDIDEEMVKYNNALAAITAEVETAQAHVTQSTQSISSISARLEAYNQKIVDLKLEHTSCSADLENSANTLKRLKEFQEDGIKRLQQLRLDNIRKEEKKAGLEEKISEHERSLSHMYEEMKSVEAVLNINKNDFHAIDEALKKNDRIISEIKGEREETLQKIRILELELSEKRIKCENLENRALERHHCSIDDLRNSDSSEGADIQMSVQEMEQHLKRFREKMARIGDVNLGAIEEYKALKERFDFLSEQRDDLIKAMDDLHRVIKKINRITQQRFMETFQLVNEKLSVVFPKLFVGGTARLDLTEPNNPLETGVEYLVHPAGKKLSRMSLLSGGEKALSAIAFIFSIFLIKPASFCLMDEIDAPLDDANVQRFNELLKLIGQKSQIIMITHNKSSMEFADTLFGITMEQKGVSKVVSVNISQPSMN